MVDGFVSNYGFPLAFFASGFFVGIIFLLKNLVC